MNITRVAAIIYAIVTLGVVAFQIALAAGAPWGAYAMGGASPGQFPPALRISAIIQAVLVGRNGARDIGSGWARLARMVAGVSLARMDRGCTHGIKSLPQSHHAQRG